MKFISHISVMGYLWQAHVIHNGAPREIANGFIDLGNGTAKVFDHTPNTVYIPYRSGGRTVDIRDILDDVEYQLELIKNLPQRPSHG